ncbi:hypothetical protein KBD59_04040 [Candidatus Gracilibacteria bacterium]|nr:hypothetical protein [Candidatus Gracilibacteria bacterium]
MNIDRDQLGESTQDTRTNARTGRAVQAIALMSALVVGACQRIDFHPEEKRADSPDADTVSTDPSKVQAGKSAMITAPQIAVSPENSLTLHGNKMPEGEKTSEEVVAAPPQAQGDPSIDTQADIDTPEQLSDAPDLSISPAWLKAVTPDEGICPPGTVPTFRPRPGSAPKKIMPKDPTPINIDEACNISGEYVARTGGDGDVKNNLVSSELYAGETTTRIACCRADARFRAGWEESVDEQGRAELLLTDREAHTRQWMHFTKTFRYIGGAGTITTEDGVTCSVGNVRGHGWDKKGGVRVKDPSEASKPIITEPNH